MAQTYKQNENEVMRMQNKTYVCIFIDLNEYGLTQQERNILKIQTEFLNNFLRQNYFVIKCLTCVINSERKGNKQTKYFQFRL